MKVNAQSIKISILCLSIISGILCTIFVPFTNKEIIGLLIGCFAPAAGFLLAMMYLAGNTLNILTKSSWKTLEHFKITYIGRILFSAHLSFILLFTVMILALTLIFDHNFLLCGSKFLSGFCFVYVLYLPYYMSIIYIDMYNFILKERKQDQKKIA